MADPNLPQHRLHRRRARGIERMLTTIRIDKRLHKVLKAYAELRDLNLSGLLEDLAAAAILGEPPLPEADRDPVRRLCDLCGLDPQDLKAKARPRPLRRPAGRPEAED